MTILKNSEIIVKVEEALADLLVVSYSLEEKKYQGVLLDITKKNLPYGVYNLHPALNNTITDNGKLHSVSQRFTYQEHEGVSEIRRGPGRPSKARFQKKQKMTVRLRPRKVLCSNCQGICNENSENVNLQKRKYIQTDSGETMNEDIEKKFLMGSMLIPKLSRLNPNEISCALNKGKKTKYENLDYKTTETGEGACTSEDAEQIPHEMAFVDIDNNDNEKFDTNGKMDCMNFFKSAKTLKICFGEGEGTVVKIPPIGDQNEDSGVCDLAGQSQAVESKSARRAKRKAKKLSRKRETNASNLKSNIIQKHIGALSPRNNVCDSTTENSQKIPKQRIKHRKKHRLNKERDENTSKADEELNYFIELKGHTNRNSSTDQERVDYVTENTSEEWEGDAVPDFPNTGTEGAAETSLHVSPGDIVWGKVIGFPWWPGRVISVTATAKAHVAWFACTTSSLMPCDSLCPFLEDYKIRFNKRKRGTYKEAVKQAAQEAKLIESQVKCTSDNPAPAPSLSNVNMSPRQINFIS